MLNATAVYWNVEKAQTRPAADTTWIRRSWKRIYWQWFSYLFWWILGILSKVQSQFSGASGRNMFQTNKTHINTYSIFTFHFPKHSKTSYLHSFFLTFEYTVKILLAFFFFSTSIFQIWILIFIEYKYIFYIRRTISCIHCKETQENQTGSFCHQRKISGNSSFDIASWNNWGIYPCKPHEQLVLLKIACLLVFR